jgi:hypothetical protein
MSREPEPARIDRRAALASGGSLLAACVTGGARVDPAPLDGLLAAHAEVLPERAGAGANHYPMAAEVLETLGAPEAIPEAWVRGARGYAGAAPRRAPIDSAASAAVAEALGDAARHGDWLDLFRAELAREPWSAVVARWTPVLTDGVSAALFHGLIRSAHAVRALRTRDTQARRDELASGLAYWASRHLVLAPASDAPPLATPLAALAPRFVAEVEDVPFDDLSARLTRVPLASARGTPRAGSAREELERLVIEAAELFEEMLVAERHRIWLLHMVTAPAAAELLRSELLPADADTLAAAVRQAVAVLWITFGAPCEPRGHLRTETPPWSELLARATASQSVHTLKLIEALARFRHVDDVLCRSVATRFLEWA